MKHKEMSISNLNDYARLYNRMLKRIPRTKTWIMTKGKKDNYRVD